MYTYVAFVDDVLAQVEDQVAGHEPERGGALLGPLGQPLITEFIYDEAARTTGVTYTPSRWLQHEVQAREQVGLQVEFKGILHSHPRSMAWPSGGDHRAYQDSLRRAPWLGRLITPIVTARLRSPEAHEIVLPSGMMSVFVAERRPGPGELEVRPAAAHVLPLSRDLTATAAKLDGAFVGLTALDVDGQLYVCGVIELAGLDLQVIAGPGYPFTAPVVIAARRPGERNEPGTGSEPPASLLPGLDGDGADWSPVRALSLTWDLTVPDESRLLSALLQRDGKANPRDGQLAGTAKAVGQQVPVGAEPVARDGERATGDTVPDATADAEATADTVPETAGRVGTSGRPAHARPALPHRILRAIARLPHRLWRLRPGGRGDTSHAEDGAPEKGDDHDAAPGD